MIAATLRNQPSSLATLTLPPFCIIRSQDRLMTDTTYNEHSVVSPDHVSVRQISFRAKPSTDTPAVSSSVPRKPGEVCSGNRKTR